MAGRRSLFGAFAMLYRYAKNSNHMDTKYPEFRLKNLELSNTFNIISGAYQISVEK